MRAKKTNDDLDTQDINLLPEEMRAVEDKARRSSRGSERVYQLREPKKERRRRAFAWLPIFGGTRWGAISEPKKDVEAAKAPQAWQQGQPQPEATQQKIPQPPASRTSDEFGVIRPILESAPEEAARGAKGGDGKGIGVPSFLGLFGRKKPRPSVEPRRESMVVPRHYSLLSKKQPLIPQPAQPLQAPSPSDVVPPTPTASSEAAGVSAAAKPHTPAQQKKPWLKSLFTAFSGFFSFFSSKGERGPLTLKIPKHSGGERDAPEPARRMPMPESEAIVRVDQAIKPTPSVTRVVMPRFEQAPPPPQRRPMRPEKRARARLPRQLDIFYWFGLLFRRNGVRVRTRPQIVKQDAPYGRAITDSDIRPHTELAAEQKIHGPGSAMPVIQTREQAPQRVSLPAAPQTPAPPQKTPAKPIEAAGKPPKPPKKDFHGLGFHFPRKQQVSEALRNLQEVNLIPTELHLRSFRHISRLMLFSILACVGFMAIIYGALSLWKYQVETRTAEIDQQIEAFKTNLIVYSTKEPEMSAVGAKVSLINSLLSRHIYWTNFFALLEKYTLPDVYYDGVSAATNGSLSLSAHGSSFETVSRLLQLLASPVAKEFVREASVTSAQLISGSSQLPQVDFTLELTLNPSLFYYATSTP